MLAKSTEYAIRSLVYIQLQNWDGKRPGFIEISKEIEAPTAFTAKILHTLTTHKFLESMKGRGGGFFFPGNESDLSLHKVILLMEGEELFTNCGFGLKACSDENPCPLHEEFVFIRDKLYGIVSSETIKSLAGKILRGNAVLNRKIKEL
jgi:Rrf2 family protein